MAAIMKMHDSAPLTLSWYRVIPAEIFNTIFFQVYSVEREVNLKIFQI